VDADLPLIADVALDVPGRDAYSYLVPDEMAAVIGVGDCVRVPFGPRTERGFVVAVARRAAPDGVRLRPIANRRQDVRLPPHLMRLIAWGARYYRCSLGEFLAGAVPSPVREGVAAEITRYVAPVAGFAGKLTKRQQEVLARLPAVATTVADALVATGTTAPTLAKLAEAGAVVFTSEGGVRELRLESKDERYPLTDEQIVAVDQVGAALTAKEHRVFLLHGVTGSGKTLVYLDLAERVVAAGRQVLLLLPEIALTPQLAARVRRRFDRVAVWHSGFTDGERAEQWRAVAAGRIDLVVGTRSALFAPLPAPGIIIVDEEHEQSYKQESVPRYHARDLAVVYAGQLGVPAVLGSATPSLESVHNVRAGKYHALRLKNRPLGGQLPLATVIDMRAECHAQKQAATVSRELITRLGACRAADEQAIVLLNRRGWSPVVSCKDCGQTLMCSQCDISLTFHKSAYEVRCHYCGFRGPLPKACPACQLPALGTFGIGTEQLAAALTAAVPGLRVLRVDADTVSERQGHAKLFQAFASGAADCLVGTQMVAKGLDFPRVTLVGIVAADRGLSVPEFRAAERTFQLIAQVSGRAGRGERAGTVVLQAYDTQAPAIRCALDRQWREFYDAELNLRREYGYPPYSGLVRFLWSGPDLAKVQLVAGAHGERLRQVGGSDFVLLGPNPAGLALLKGQHRWHALVKGGSRGAIQAFLDRLDAAGGVKNERGVRVAIDVDPYATS